MAGRDPFDVLGVDPGASATTIRAAWRRLARQHHPDLTASDPSAARDATRQMAEINAAYEELRDPARRRDAAARAAGRRSGAPAAPDGQGPGAASAGGAAEATRPRGGPPRPRPGRPVTARLDTSDTFAPRNTTLSTGSRAHYGRQQPPFRPDYTSPESLRASEPTGPLRRARVRGFEAAPPPPIAEARDLVLEFGKFRGHTLAEVAAFEPSYIDWISGTITKDPQLVAAARVIRDDLDARGIWRPHRPARPGAPRI